MAEIKSLFKKTWEAIWEDFEYIFIAYLILFLIYHLVLVPLRWTENVGKQQLQTTPKYANKVFIDVIYPQVIRYMPTKGQPLTILAYKKGDGPLAVNVEFSESSTDEDTASTPWLVFRSENGKEIAHEIKSAVLGISAESAPRYVIFVSKRTPQLGKGPKDILVRAYNTSKEEIGYGEIHIKVESFWEYILRKWSGKLFGGIAIGVWGTMVALYRIYETEQEKLERQKRENAEKMLERLEKEGSKKDGIQNWGLMFGDVFSHLKEYFAREDSIRRRYEERLRFIAKNVRRTYSGRPWLLSFYDDLIDNLRRKEPQTNLNELDWLRDIGVDEEERESIRWLIDLYSNITSVDVEEAISKSVQVFRTLGGSREAAEAIIKVLRRDSEQREETTKEGLAVRYSPEGPSEKNEDEITKEWQRTAAGRYLLSKWKPEKLQQDPPLPFQLRGKARLFPQEPLFNIEDLLPSSSDEELQFWRWFTPFGPVKGEYDPRLVPYEGNRPEELAEKALFWEHPQWSEIIKPEDGWFQVPRGGGLSTFVRVGYYQRSPWSRATPGFSILLPLGGKPSEERFWQMFDEALAETMLRYMSHDPYFYLVADEPLQKMIAAWLLRPVGGCSALDDRLTAWGLPLKPKSEEEKDLFLLRERLLERAITVPESYLIPRFDLLSYLSEHISGYTKERMVHYKISRIPLFVWTEVDDGNIADWLYIAKHQIYTKSHMYSGMYFKFFFHANDNYLLPQNASVTSITWSNEDITYMLYHRAEQAGYPKLTEEKWKEKIEGMVQISKTTNVILTPKHVIATGNRILTNITKTERGEKRE